MRYRIVIEVEIDDNISRQKVRELAVDAMNELVTAFSNPVYLSIEKVEDKFVHRS